MGQLGLEAGTEHICCSKQMIVTSFAYGSIVTPGGDPTDTSRPSSFIQLGGKGSLYKIGIVVADQISILFFKL